MDYCKISELKFRLGSDALILNRNYIRIHSLESKSSFIDNTLFIVLFSYKHAPVSLAAFLSTQL